MYDIGAYEYDPSIADADGDGRLDLDEIDIGFNPFFDEAMVIEYGQAQGRADVTSNPFVYGLYTTNSISDLDMGYMMIQTSNGWVRLNLQLEKCTNLTEGVWNDAGNTVLWQVPADSGKSFFRVRGRE